jgi:pyruvate formate-lyase/glycerol dehydratase family glycyl radical enzyme
MTDRIKRMMDRLKVDKFPFCAEKARLVIESWKQHEGLTPILARAYATAHYLDNRTLFVEDDELIVGNVAAKPMGMEASCWGPFWDDDDLDMILQGNYTISDEDRKALREMDSFWEGQGRQMYEWQGRFYDDERMWPFIRSGVLCPPWKDKTKGRGSGGAGFGWGLGIGLSFFIPDYGKIISEGINKTLQEAKEELRKVRYVDNDSFDKAMYLQAVIIALEAMVRMYHRYGDVCLKKAEETANETRKKELLRMADTCHWIAENPSRDFRDAMQNFWFYWMMITHGTVPGGRFDQYMYPYYKKDIESGALTKEEVLELLECLRIKIMQFNFVSGAAQQRDKWAGMARWHNFVIGGVDRDGNDATNELSYLVLEAANQVRVPHYTITVRVNENTPDELMKKSMELVRTGIGMPAFVSDKSYIQGLVDQGVPIEDARDFALAGCLDLNLPGKSRINALGMFIVPKVLDITMHNGIMRETGERIGPETGEMKDFKTFEDFYEAFKKQLYHFMSMYNEEHNILIRVTRQVNCDVVHSAFAHDGIKCGRDIMDRKMPYENASLLNPVGMICVVNSMAAIKDLVFDKKLFTMEELYKAIEANWEGYEHIRKLCLEAPKYGNNIDMVDNIAVDLYKFWVDSCNSFTTVYGVPPRPTGISITAHAPGGSYTCATPDGRRAGETLPDGVLSPAQGTDKHGPTAMLSSALKVNQDPFNAMLLNMKIHPSALQTEEDLMKLAALVKTYLLNGGKHIQFNVVDDAVLRKAQEKPDEYRDLIVRVAGYSTYFTLLTKPVQDEIIARTAHTLA